MSSPITRSKNIGPATQDRLIHVNAFRPFERLPGFEAAARTGFTLPGYELIPVNVLWKDCV